MRITQGTFSFLPDLTDEQIEAQIRYALRQGWAITVEYTDDPHPRNASGRCGRRRSSTSRGGRRRRHARGRGAARRGRTGT